MTFLLAVALAATAAPLPAPPAAPTHSDTDFSDVKPRPAHWERLGASGQWVLVDSFGQIQNPV